MLVAASRQMHSWLVCNTNRQADLYRGVYLDLAQQLLCLVASPAALNPDGSALGLKELHPGQEASESCLQMHNIGYILQVGSALTSTSADGLKSGDPALQLCSSPAGGQSLLGYSMPA